MSDLEESRRMARERLQARESGVHLRCDWLDAVFLDFAVDADRLQRDVPFPLACWNGQAYVSLVAFTLRALRPSWGGRLAALAFAPIATHQFLNVRTYVNEGDASGIYFLAEWLNNPLSVRLGPLTHGLPYRYGTLTYDHRIGPEPLNGQVTAGDRWIIYDADPADGMDLRGCEPGTRDGFLRERYTAFTARRGVRRFFHVGHEPWLGLPLDARVRRADLLTPLGDWTRDLELVGGWYSPGVTDVRMGRPHWL